MAHTSAAAESRLSTRTFEQEAKTAARFPMFVHWSLAIALAGSLVGCGDDSSSSSPSAPSSTSSTASSVNVTLTSPIRMGQTAQASAVAALSNGQSQNVTSGWRSDNVGVATVTDAGLATGVANGQATIYVITGGRQGQRVIRVVPDYHGAWEGSLRVTSCTQTGIFSEFGACSDFPMSSGVGFDLSLLQTGEAMNARLDLRTRRSDGGLTDCARRVSGLHGPCESHRRGTHPDPRQRLAAHLDRGRCPEWHRERRVPLYRLFR